jgi:hypothetical protein
VERVDHRWRRGGAGGAETERSRNRDGVMRLFGPERWMECTQRGQLMPCSSMEAWVHHFQSRYGRASSRCKFFVVWLLLQNRIWTADRLMSREWPKQYFYPLCYRNLETTDHLFIECPWSRRIWMDNSRWTLSSCLQPHCRRAS